MSVTATEAKNRFGQLLEQAQRAPVVIEKSGRRHSVLLSAEQYDRLLAAQRGLAAEEPTPPRYGPEAQAFYEKYKDWVDEQRAHFERHGIWNEEFRTW
ncbi:MAG: type II toxin-antitoxin system Phd/YefM family antitoxin [Rubrivivax sp.]